MPQWIFAKLDPAAVRRDPNETQLFKAEQAGEGEYAGTDALVREILQNSMDAGTGNGPVRVRLALHPKADLPDGKVLTKYFARLESPLKHRDIAFNKSEMPVLPNGFMVCEDFGTRGLGGETRIPEMTEAAFTPKDLQDLRESVEREQLVAVKVRINLHRTAGKDVEGEMTVWLQRQQPDLRCDTYYVREGMTITKLNSKAGLKGIQALVLVDKGPLAQLLGDSEGPAHEDWDTSEERPDRLWKKWKGRVTFCRKIVDFLLEVLAPPTRKADFNLLSDFFSVEKIESPQKARRPDDNGAKDPTFKGIVAKPRWFRLDPKCGGFRIVANASQPIAENAELTVSVAYDVPAGNPLKKWSSFDFDFTAKQERIGFKGEYVKAQKISGNVLKLTSFSPKFWFAAEGFDAHSDLFVRVEEAGESTVDTSEAESEETEA